MPAKKQIKKEQSIEEAFDELNSILENLEKEEITLEDSFQLYQEGIKLIQYCNEKIDKVEKQLIILENAEEADEF